MSQPKIYIHLVRHAQGFHNLNRANHALPDPDLTPLGKEQCAALCAAFPHHDKITHLVASPMRRTLYTCLLSFVPAVEAGKVVTALPEIQEISNLPCDTGSDAEKLKAEFGAKVDFGLVKDGWNDKSAGSPWAPEMKRLEERALKARRWLRELGRKALAEAGNDGRDVHIAAVTHGGFLHFLTQDYAGMSLEKGTGWDNTEYRTYEFVHPEKDEDEEARLREVKASWRRRRDSHEKGLTETEQRELRAVVEDAISKEFGAPMAPAGAVVDGEKN